MLPEDFPRLPMQSLAAIKRDRAWRPPLILERLSEKRLGGRDIPLGAGQKFDYQLCCRTAFRRTNLDGANQERGPGFYIVG
jgi:hypothetical protein